MAQKEKIGEYLTPAVIYSLNMTQFPAYFLTDTSIIIKLVFDFKDYSLLKTHVLTTLNIFIHIYLVAMDHKMEKIK